MRWTAMGSRYAAGAAGRAGPQCPGARRPGCGRAYLPLVLALALPLTALVGDPGRTWAMAGARPQPARPPQPGGPVSPLVLDSITVVDVATGHLAPAQRVVIVGDRIQTIGDPRTVRVPTGAQVVPARGKYLIPGLWDMHGHNFTATPETWATYLAAGVTGVRDLVTMIPLDTLHAWRRQVAAGRRIGPRVVSTGPYLTDYGTPLSDSTPGPSGWPPQIGAATPDQGRRAVAWFQAHGADFIKLHGDFPRPTFFAIAAEARRVHIPIAGHLPMTVSMAEASDSGQHSLEHVNLFPGPCWRADSAGRRACGALIARLNRNDTWLTPTLAACADATHNIHADAATAAGPDTFTVTAPDYRTYVLQDTTTGFKLNAATLNIQDWLWFIHGLLPFHPRLLAGVDAPFGYQRLIDGPRQYTDSERVLKIHTELELFVTAGLTPLQALQTATLNPAKYFGATDSLGTVAPHHLADLVLLDANPLADIRNTRQIAAVVANGRYFDRAALDVLFTAARQREASAQRP